jgi:tRNA-splicing ligase RtcB
MTIQQVFQPSNGERIGAPVKVWTDYIEPKAMEQLRALACMPFIHSHVAVMPDVHWGNGTSVGTVIATKGAIIPSAVGVDIGCGMMACQLNLIASDLPDNLGPMRTAIEAAIPHGRTDNGGSNDRGAWGNPPVEVCGAFGSLIDGRFLRMKAKHPQILKKANDLRHLGTLGTGNHFVELCLDKADNVWLMLHSGSRGIGNRIGSYFIEKAKELMLKYFISLDSRDLAYLPADTPLFEDYWSALSWAQDYARKNRELMMIAAIKAVNDVMRPDPSNEIGLIATAINCHHNYAVLENHYGRNVYVTRKGAVRAREGDLGIIPGSMGARSFIVRGRGNTESFCSCSRGAGRRMSRTEAKRAFSAEDLAAQTQGVECRKDKDVIDEIPGAYKDIQQVMDFQSDLVDVVAELKQVLCVKG